MKWQAVAEGKAIKITNGTRTEQMPVAEARSLYQALGTCFNGGSGGTGSAVKSPRNAAKGAKKGGKKC